MSNSFSGVVRLGRDAELKTIGAGTLCEFSAASNFGFGKNKGSFWIRGKIWGKQGEAVAKHLTKGKQVWVSGELSTNDFERKDGTKATAIELRVHELEFVGGRSSDDQVETKPQQSQPTGSDKDGDMPF